MKFIEGWKPKRLSELADYVNGFAFKPDDWGKDGLPIIRIEQLKNPKSVADYFSGRLPKKNVIDNGDLIFSWSASLFLRIWQHGKAALNQHLFKVVEKAEIDRVFLKQFIEFHLPEITKASHGSTMQHITRKELDRFGAPFPTSKPEQAKIAEVLSTVDRAIEQTEALIAKQQRIKTGLMQDLLTRGIDKNGTLRPPPDQTPHLYKYSPFGMIPKEWDPMLLRDMSDTFAGGTPSRAQSKFYGGKIPWVKSAEVNLDEIDSTEEHITEAGVRGSSAKWVRPRTTLVAMYGATAGQVSWLQVQATTNQAVLAVPPRDDGTVSRWLFWALTFISPRLIASVQGSGQPNLSKSVIDRVELARPRKHEQDAIAERLDQQAERLKVERNYLDKLQLIKQALMQDLLKGKVRVTLLLSEPQEAGV